MAARRICLILTLVTLGAVVTHGPARAQAAATPEAPESKLQAHRASFVEAVKEGTLVGFDEALGVVRFRPTKPLDTAHQPGPLEDEVIASAVRAGAAESAELRGLRVKVECQAGSLRLAEATASAAQLADLIQLALGVEGVREVCAELPRSLKARPAA